MANINTLTSSHEQHTNHNISCDTKRCTVSDKYHQCYHQFASVLPHEGRRIHRTVTLRGAKLQKHHISSCSKCKLDGNSNSWFADLPGMPSCLRGARRRVLRALDQHGWDLFTSWILVNGQVSTLVDTWPLVYVTRQIMSVPTFIFNLLYSAPEETNFFHLMRKHCYCVTYWIHSAKFQLLLLNIVWLWSAAGPPMNNERVINTLIL